MVALLRAKREALQNVPSFGATRACGPSTWIELQLCCEPIQNVPSPIRRYAGDFELRTLIQLLQWPDL